LGSSVWLPGGDVGVSERCGPVGVGDGAMVDGVLLGRGVGNVGSVGLAGTAIGLPFVQIEQPPSPVVAARVQHTTAAALPMVNRCTNYPLRLAMRLRNK
jgi:hypothetical protein